MIRRLRVKFICINMAIVTVMMLAILGMLLHFTRNDLEQQSIRVMQSVMEDRAYPSRPGEFPRQAKLPYFYVSVNTMGELSASFGGYYDLTNTEAIQQIITLALNSDDQTGILKDYSLRFQKRTTPFGQTIVFVDMSSELTTMRSLTNTCVIIGVLSFAVFLGLSFLLARWAVKPVETAWNQQRQFVADASHELKTPLTSLLLNVNTLQTVYLPEEKQAALLDSMDSQLHWLETMVKKLLTLLSLQKNAKLAETSVPALLEQVRLLTGEVCAKYGVALKIQYRVETLFLDKDLLCSAQVNLVENGAKASKPGDCIEILADSTGFTVTDHGRGIPEKDLARVTDPFYMGDPSRSKQSGGFGLGLALVKEIAAAHGGTLELTSRPGQGTAAKIRLPKP